MVRTVDSRSSATVNRIPSALEFRNRFGRPSTEVQTESSVDAERQRLANELANELWSRLPISRLADEVGYRGIEQIVRIASASHSLVATWHRELRDFVSIICQTAIEYRGDDVSAEFRATLTSELKDQLVNATRFPIPSPSFVDFRFADLDPAKAMAVAEQELENLCLQFADQLFGLLEELRQQRIVGTVQNGKSTCRFTFFRRVAILNKGARRLEQRYALDPEFASHWHKAYYIDTYETASVNVQHRHALHVHHVRQPVLRVASDTKYPLPEKYRQLVESCPEWLRPSLRVLEGDLFREEQLEWDVLSETRPNKLLVKSEWVRCPAIVFGDYVLAGWGEQTIVGEEGRLRDEQSNETKETFAKKSRQLQVLALVMATLAIALIPFSVGATPAVASLAILIGLSAMLTSASAAHFAFASRGRISTGRVLLHGSLIGSTVFAIQGLIYSILHWSLFAFGMAVLFAMIAAITIAVKRYDGEFNNFRVD